MTETQRPSAYSGQPATARYTSPPEAVRAETPTGWVGWIVFAGVMLLMVGTFQFIAGLVALFKDGYFAVPSADLVISVDYTAWGFTHMVLGVLAAAAGVGVMVGATWARIYAIGLAFLSAVANLTFISAAPVWGTMVIALDVLVIWALAVHGREMRTE